MRNIRYMQEKDLGRVVQLYQDANTFATKESILDWTRNDLHAFPELHLVYQEGEQIRGAISGVIEKGIGVIEDIAVDPTYRGKGIGDLLLNYLIQRMREHNLPAIRLVVHQSNERAIPFYQRHHFVVKHRGPCQRVKDIPDGEELTTMEIVLV